MTKDRSWMYDSIESSEFFDGVLEFCSISVEHQVRRGGGGSWFLLSMCQVWQCIKVK